MQAQQANWVQYLTVILVAVMFVVSGWAVLSFEPEEQTPTAAEIAALVVIPEVVIPEFPDLSTNRINIRGSNFDDLLEGVYPDEVEDLIEDCAEDLLDEFGDDVNADIRDLVEDDIGEEIENYEVIDFNYDDDFDWEIVDLGIHDEDDREIKFFSRLEFEYTEVFGNNDEFTVEVLSQARCSDWDDDENRFDDLEVDYTLP